MTLNTHITLVRDVGPGRGISYGRDFITKEPMRIATLAMGYADGYPRQTSNKGAQVLIRGKRCPILGRITMDQFINQWITVISRYQDRPQLTGIDVFNEDQGTDAAAWNTILRQITTSLENRFPGRFYFFCGGTRWGGDISGIDIEDVPFHDRVIYTIHKYVFSSSGDYEKDWDYSFGPYASIPGKVSVGEFGWKQDQYDQVQWAIRFIEYLKRRNIRNNYFWTIALSGDTSGLYQDDCQTFQWDKYNLLKGLWNYPARYLRGSLTTVLS
jgi:hypothetical protein